MVTLSLVSVHFPGNAEVFLSLMNDLASLDIFSGEIITGAIFQFQFENPFNT